MAILASRLLTFAKMPVWGLESPKPLSHHHPGAAKDERPEHHVWTLYKHGITRGIDAAVRCYGHGKFAAALESCSVTIGTDHCAEWPAGRGTAGQLGIAASRRETQFSD